MQYLYSILFSLLNLSVFSQKHIVPVPLKSPATLHPMPLAFTGVTPDIYLPGDSVRKPHVRTHFVEVTSLRNTISNNDLIDMLRSKALAEGLDGVIINELATRTPNLTFETTIHALAGIGIKYLDNISHLETILRQRVITRFLPDGNQDKTTLLDFDWHGKLLTPMNSDDIHFYADSMSVIDLNLIFNRLVPMHNYRIIGPEVQRIVSDPLWRKRIVHNITYNDQQIEYLLSRSTTYMQSSNTLRIKTIPKFTEDRLSGAVIYRRGRNAQPLYYLHYKYDTLGRITNERWEKLIDGKRTLWLEVENRFFEADQALILQLAKGKP